MKKVIEEAEVHSSGSSIVLKELYLKFIIQNHIKHIRLIAENKNHNLEEVSCTINICLENFLITRFRKNEKKIYVVTLLTRFQIPACFQRLA